MAVKCIPCIGLFVALAMSFALGAAPQPPVPQKDHEALTLIRVLVVRTPEVMARMTEAEWTAYLDDRFAVANTAFEESGASVAFEVVGVRDFPIEDELDASHVLAQFDINWNHANYSEAMEADVEDARVALDAHLVVIFQNTAMYAELHPQVDLTDVDCTGGGGTESPRNGFSVVTIAPPCDPLVLARVLAASVGANSWSIPYAVGHTNGVPVRTIMTADSDVPQVARFSSPLIDCSGEPCGVADVADNVRAMDERRHAVDAWITDRSIALTNEAPMYVGGHWFVDNVATGVVGGRIDVELWRDGVFIAKLLDDVPQPHRAQRYDPLAPVPSGLAPGDGYTVVVSASAAPHVRAEKTVAVRSGYLKLSGAYDVVPAERSVAFKVTAAFNGDAYSFRASARDASGADVSAVTARGPTVESDAPIWDVDWNDHELTLGGLECGTSYSIGLTGEAGSTGVVEYEPASANFTTAACTSSPAAQPLSDGAAAGDGFAAEAPAGDEPADEDTGTPDTSDASDTPDTTDTTDTSDTSDSGTSDTSDSGTSDTSDPVEPPTPPPAPADAGPEATSGGGAIAPWTLCLLLGLLGFGRARMTTSRT